MSENETAEADPRLKKSHWYWFDGKMVLIQLMEPWSAVTHPSAPARTQDVVDGEPQGPVYTPTSPIMRGVLHVYPDVGPGGVEDVMFVLETPDCDPAKERSKLSIGIKRELVAYITASEESLIQRM